MVTRKESFFFFFAGRSCFFQQANRTSPSYHVSHSSYTRKKPFKLPKTVLIFIDDWQ